MSTNTKYHLSYPEHSFGSPESWPCDNDGETNGITYSGNFSQK